MRGKRRRETDRWLKCAGKEGDWWLLLSYALSPSLFSFWKSVVFVIVSFFNWRQGNLREDFETVYWEEIFRRKKILTKNNPALHANVRVWCVNFKAKEKWEGQHRHCRCWELGDEHLCVRMGGKIWGFFVCQMFTFSNRFHCLTRGKV